ncbi:MAG: hypothetical protein DYG89_04130 [Caldilinea sp. CFX5]|nr:hypothetical protein [Caldilinea sp. CFX5]
MYQFVINSADLQPYLVGEKPLTELAPAVAAHVANLLNWQQLQVATHPVATAFDELDRRSQAIYRAIAAALPGCTVYATGSRVRGTWRSGAPNDPKTTIAQRVGKPIESDVDVIVIGADNITFRQAVAPVAASFGVRIDRQPPTLHPQILVTEGETERCN